jgi:hypothetical protein
VLDCLLMHTGTVFYGKKIHCIECLKRREQPCYIQGGVQAGSLITGQILGLIPQYTFIILLVYNDYCSYLNVQYSIIHEFNMPHNLSISDPDLH